MAEALRQAGLSGRPLHSLPHDPNLAVTVAFLGAPSVTSRAPAERPRPFSEIRCLSLLCVRHELLGAAQVWSRSFVSLRADL